MKKIQILTWIFAALFLAAACSSGGDEPANPGGSEGGGGGEPQPEANVTSQVYKPGESGYAAFRIPAVVVSKAGTVLAFAEGRVDGSADDGNIDLLVKRSEDNGNTWSTPIKVYNDGENRCQNPAPVVLDNGRILLLFCWNERTPGSANGSGSSGHPRRVMKTYSDDDGKTWSTPEDIHDQVAIAGYTWYATGPCHAIVKTLAPNKGRIVVPCNHNKPGTNPKSERHAHLIYSDDQGATWHLGAVTDHLLKSTMHLKDPNPDIYPHQSVITVRNAKTGSVWAQKEFQLYSVAAGAATHVGTYTTGADGKWTGELLSGLYRIACRFDDNLPEMTATTADFSIKRDMPNTGEIDVLPVLFWDDFSWVEADWGEQQLNGQLAEIMPWYASVDPPTANSAAQREQQWTSLKNQEHIAIRDSKGYLTPGTFQPTGTARFIFFRTGMIKFGTTKRSGAFGTPKIAGLAANSTILFTFDANPLHTVSGGAWSIPDSKNALKLKITLSGAGSFKEGEAMGEVLLDNPSGLEGGWPVDRWNNLSVTVYGADADTQIVIGTPNEPDTPARFMVDNFVIKEVL